MIWFFIFLSGVFAIVNLKLYLRIKKFTGAMELASHYVRTLAQGKFGLPLPEEGPRQTKNLLRALNGLAQELKAKQETIQKLESLRIDFVANVSHELKTPLTSIKGYTETLKSGAYKQPDTAIRFLDRIEQNTDRLSSLISDLLALSRLEKFPHDLDREVFSASRFVERMEGIFFPVLAKKNQTLKVYYQDDQWEADEEQLAQVFTNLIDNASRYSPEGAKIEVLQTHKNGYQVFEFKDNGPGIPQSHLPRIFERFYRVDRARNRETGGTGLGLSIVKHIVLSHGGQISVKSEVGEGTCFTMRLPRFLAGSLQ